MAAYFIVDITITDPKEYEEYKKLTPASLAAYDGKFIVRGGLLEKFEGEWKPERLVILEFPSMEKAREWYHSEIYTQAKAIRLRSADTNMILVDGM